MASINLQKVKQKRGVDLTVWPPRYDAGYRPASDEEYWFPEIECADTAQRNEIILLKLRKQIQYAWEYSSFYRRKWQQADVSPETLKSLDDLERFPVVQKLDLREAQHSAPPFGDYLASSPGKFLASMGQVARLAVQQCLGWGLRTGIELGRLTLVSCGEPESDRTTES